MPDATPARLPLTQALDESLAAMFRSLQSEPAPASLISLADQLEDAWRRATVPGETRTIGQAREG
jgi:hypothetical protein